MNVEVNYMAVLLAAVAAMTVGFVWYGPLFGKPWMKMKGFTKESMEKAKKGMGMMYGLTFILSLLMAYILTHVMVFSMNFYHYAAVQTGLTSAFWMWLGFVFPVQATYTIFGDKNVKLLAIDTGHHLAALLAMGAIIGMMMG